MRPVVCVLVAPLIALACPAGGVASELHYSWAGRLVAANQSSNDPWLIRSDGAEFRLQATASSAAGDQDATQAVAIFSASSLCLWIDGVEAPSADVGVIEFSESVLDLVIVSGRFRRLGEVLDVTSVVGLPATTFSFDLLAETPPFFLSTATAGQGASGGAFYVAVVEAGAAVIVTPEPGFQVLGASGLALALLRRRR